MKYSFLFLILFSFQNTSHASFELPQLERGDVENVSKELMTNFTHTSVSPASALGRIFGVEAGLVAGLTSASDMGALTEEATGSKVDTMPHAGLLGRVSTPFGVTFEGVLLPKLKPKNGEIGSVSFAAQWNFLHLPLFHTAIKAHFSTSSFEFNQEIENDADGSVEYKTTNYGLLPMASFYAGIVEPYIGLGLIRGDSTLSYSASSGNELFEFTDSDSVDVKETSTHVVIGTQINLLLMKFGVEYSRMFENDRYSAKFSLAF